MAGAIFPLCLIGFVFSEEIMVTWMGTEFSCVPSLILKILIIGYFFNCIAQIPFADIQASGKSKTTAMLHLCEVLPYFALLFMLVNF